MKSLKTIDEARHDVIEQIGTYAGCAAMHDEAGKDAVSLLITAALDQLELAVRRDELSKFRAIAERTGDAEGAGKDPL